MKPAPPVTSALTCARFYPWVRAAIKVSKVVEPNAQQWMVAHHFQRRLPEIQTEATCLAERIEPLGQDARDGQAAHHDQRASCGAADAQRQPTPAQRDCHDQG